MPRKWMPQLAASTSQGDTSLKVNKRIKAACNYTTGAVMGKLWKQTNNAKIYATWLIF